MCGRYLIDNEISNNELYAALYNSSAASQGFRAKWGEVFPTDAAPVLTTGAQGLKASLMIWGFPKYTDKGVVINARAETARQKPMFANAVKYRRCVVPSSGFYEWRHDGRGWSHTSCAARPCSRGKAIEKLLFRLDAEPVLYMAGLFSERPERRFVILTREPNDVMRPIHNRMPVILTEESLISWITDDSFIETAFSRETNGLSYQSS